ncbi:rod shape-determining protein MreD [candidate division KSB1 bacterium]|nr:rod shape-determining protein MreD [candidate division KSB1 bacterium]
MFKRIFKYVLMFSFLLALQIAVVPLLAFSDVHPDFLLIGVILAALRHGAMPAILTGFLVGLVQDVAVSELYGLQALAKSVAGFVAGYLARDKTKFELQTAMALAFAAALTHNVVRDTVFYFDTGFNFFYVLLRYALPNSIYTVAFVAIIQMLWPEALRNKPSVD